MKNTLLGAFILFVSISSFAADITGDLFNERMAQRYTHINFETFKPLAFESAPPEIQGLLQAAQDDLESFATAYNLFELGWSYSKHENIYEVTTTDGEILAYTFSVVISKNGIPTGRRFYQASKRVDGVFFVERIADYDL